MVWRDIIFGHRAAVVQIDGGLTAEWDVILIGLVLVRPLVQAVPCILFPQDTALSHVTRRTHNSVDGIDMLPWISASHDISPMEHVWDFNGRQLHQTPT